MTVWQPEQLRFVVKFKENPKAGSVDAEVHSIPAIGSQPAFVYTIHREDLEIAQRFIAAALDKRYEDEILRAEYEVERYTLALGTAKAKLKDLKLKRHTEE